VKTTPEVQALTLRIPIEDYRLLRAEAFVRDLSINEVVVQAIRDSIDADRRRKLVEMLEQAKAARSLRGAPSDVPRNPHRKGPKGRPTA
jgi:hypothetical protein